MTVCTTFDCDEPATCLVQIEDKGWHPYCDRCGELCARGGLPPRPLAEIPEYAIPLRRPDRPYGREVSLTVGQIMYLLAATTPVMDWGRHRRAAIRAKLLAVLEPDERNGIEA